MFGQADTMLTREDPPWRSFPVYQFQEAVCLFELGEVPAAVEDGDVKVPVPGMAIGGYLDGIAVFEPPVNPRRKAVAGDSDIGLEMVLPSALSDGGTACGSPRGAPPRIALGEAGFRHAGAILEFISPAPRPRPPCRGRPSRWYQRRGIVGRGRRDGRPRC